MPEKGIIAIIGAGSCDENISRIAERMGKLIAEAGFVLVCGGVGGGLAA